MLILPVVIVHIFILVSTARYASINSGKTQKKFISRDYENIQPIMF